MSGFLTDQDVAYNKDFSPGYLLENVEARYNTDTHVLYNIFPENGIISKDQGGYDMENGNIYIDKNIKEFLVEKWISRLDFIQQTEDEFLTEEEIDQPNELAINYTYQLILKLADKNIFPDKISTSAEEGICLKFKNRGKVLYFEIYNTGELGYIIEDRTYHKTLENEDLFSLEEMVEKVNDFILN